MSSDSAAASIRGVARLAAYNWCNVLIGMN